MLFSHRSGKRRRLLGYTFSCCMSKLRLSVNLLRSSIPPSRDTACFRQSAGRILSNQGGLTMPFTAMDLSLIGDTPDRLNVRIWKRWILRRDIRFSDRHSVHPTGRRCPAIRARRAELDGRRTRDENSGSRTPRPARQVLCRGFSSFACAGTMPRFAGLRSLARSGCAARRWGLPIPGGL